jgi:hypothetical protein
MIEWQIGVEFHPQQERACKMLFYFNLLSFFQHYVNNTIAIDFVVLSLSLQAYKPSLSHTQSSFEGS